MNCLFCGQPCVVHTQSTQSIHSRHKDTTETTECGHFGVRMDSGHWEEGGGERLAGAIGSSSDRFARADVAPSTQQLYVLHVKHHHTVAAQGVSDRQTDKPQSPETLTSPKACTRNRPRTLSVSTASFCACSAFSSAAFAVLTASPCCQP